MWERSLFKWQWSWSWIELSHSPYTCQQLKCHVSLSLFGFPVSCIKNYPLCRTGWKQMQKGYRLPQKKMLMGSSPSTVCHFYKLSPPHPTWALEVYEAAKLWVRGSSASCVLGTLLRAHSQEFRIFSQLSETLLYLPTFPGFSLTKGPDLGLRLHPPHPLTPSPAGTGMCGCETCWPLR